jgi:hypothetical protein
VLWRWWQRRKSSVLEDFYLIKTFQLLLHTHFTLFSNYETWAWQNYLSMCHCGWEHYHFADGNSPSEYV